MEPAVARLVQQVRRNEGQTVRRELAPPNTSLTPNAKSVSHAQ